MDDASEVITFVLKTLRPPGGTLSRFAIERPDWVDDPNKIRLLMKLAERVGALIPVLSRVQSQRWWSEAPEEVSLAAHEKCERARFLQSVLSSEYESLAQLLVVSDVTPMVIGGYCAAHRFYPSPDERQVDMIDFLIQQQEYSTAMRVLGRSGYRLSEASPNPVNGDVILVNASGPTPVRLRRVLVEFGEENRRTSEADRLWQRAFEGRLPEMPRSVKVLSTEDMLERLLRRGALHRLYASPVLLNDLHYVIRHLVATGNFGSEGILDRLARSRMLSASYFILSLLAEEWGTPVPRSFLESAEARLSIVGKRISRRLRNREGFLFSAERRGIRWTARLEYLARQSAWDMMKKGMRDAFSLSPPNAIEQRALYIGGKNEKER